MSWILIVGLIVVLVAVFSQFGGRLQASQALSWWLFSLFLLISVIAPTVWQPLVHALGIELVSNFVMAVSIVFLFLQVLETSSTQASAVRKNRRLVTSLAAEAYLARALPPAQEKRHKVLVILPCYNEEEAIPRLIAALQHGPASSAIELRYCFVDDGSSDGTPQVLKNLAPRDHATHHANVGVSGVLMTGFRIMLDAGYDYAVQCDGDGQHPVEEIARLVMRAAEERLDLLIASRYAAPLGGDATSRNQLESTTRLRKLGSDLIRYTLAVLWKGAPSSDPTSGFRVFSRGAAKLLLTCMPDDYPEPETIALLADARLRIGEAHCFMRPRESGASSIGGFRSVRYMYKVITALLGLRLRQAYRRRRRIRQAP